MFKSSARLTHKKLVVGKARNGSEKPLESIGSKHMFLLTSNPWLWGSVKIFLAALSIWFKFPCKSKYFKDRYVFDVLELPNKLEKILIEPNEIVNSGMLNKKIEFVDRAKS